MKKLPLLFLCFIFIFGGCKSKPAFPQDRFKGNFSAVEKGAEIKGEIVSNSNNSMLIKVTSPKVMKGYTYRYKDDKLTISYENMNILSESDYLPSSAFPQIVFNVIRSLKKEDNCVLKGSYNSFAEYKGNCDSGEFTIKSEINSGFIKEISLKEIKINFKKLYEIE